MENQLKVKAPKGKFANFTSGKVYHIYNIDVNNLGFNTLSDNNIECYCLWKNCAHLNGKNWIKVKNK